MRAVVPPDINPSWNTLPPPPLDLLEGSSLFLDFDGTLVDIAERPDAIAVDQRLDALIARLALALRGRIAIISGRSLTEVDRLIAHGRFAVAGSHGIELRWPDGRERKIPPLAGRQDIVTAMRTLQADHPGLIVEEKPFGAALHYRNAPYAEAACRAVAERLAKPDGLTLQSGKMVVEVRAAGNDKGWAVSTLMKSTPNVGSKPVFIGDDETDETAFHAANEIGGVGILVGSARPTRASYRLENVTAAHLWLDQAAGALM